MGVRKWIGNRPARRDGWLFDGLVAEAEGAAWLLYARDVESKDEVQGYKLVADAYVLNKANYWFMFNNTAQKFIGKDAKILRAGRPELYQALRRYLLLDEERPVSEEQGDG